MTKNMEGYKCRKRCTQEVLLVVLVSLERIANEYLPQVFHVLRYGKKYVLPPDKVVPFVETLKNEIVVGQGVKVVDELRKENNKLRKELADLRKELKELKDQNTDKK